MYVDVNDRVIAQQLLLEGVHEEYETEIFKELVKPSNVIVVVGANIGYYTLIAARILNGTGWIYAFEPEPHNFEILVKNIRLNGFRNITASQLALSDTNGREKLFLDRSNFGCPSFAEMNIERKNRYVEVDTITLDAYFEKTVCSKIDLLKIDAQGAEGRIVQGAKGILKRLAPRIVMEFWPYGLRNVGTDPDALLTILQETGYKAKVIDRERKRVVASDIRELLLEYERQYNGKGFADLLLEKDNRTN